MIRTLVLFPVVGSREAVEVCPGPKLESHFSVPLSTDRESNYRDHVGESDFSWSQVLVCPAKYTRVEHHIGIGRLAQRIKTSNVRFQRVIERP